MPVPTCGAQRAAAIKDEDPEHVGCEFCGKNRCASLTTLRDDETRLYLCDGCRDCGDLVRDVAR